MLDFGEKVFSSGDCSTETPRGTSLSRCSHSKNLRKHFLKQSVESEKVERRQVCYIIDPDAD